MLVDTLTLLQGAAINNATIASGTTNPSTPDIGELFFRTDLNELQIYDGTAWFGFGPTVNVTSFDGRTGAVTLTSADVTTALGYTPISPTGGTITGSLVVDGTINGQTIGSATSLTGTLAVASTINGQTIGSATSLTGTLAVASTTTLASSNINGTMTFDSVHTITGLPNPTSASQAATKSYVDGIAAGLSWKEAVQAATTTNLTATFVNNGGTGDTLTNSGTQAALVIDGYTTLASDRILVKNQTTQTQNGIYVVTNIGSTTTNWILTRSTDFDATTPVNQINGATVFVENGSTQANTGWTQIDDVTAIDTSPIAFTQFSGTGAVVSSITGTTNQIVASSPDNAVTLSLAPNIVLPAPTSGNTLTVTGLAANAAGVFDITSSATGTIGILINDTFSGAGTIGQFVVSSLNNTNGANIQLQGNGTTTPNKTIRVQGGELQVINSTYSANILTLTDSGSMTIQGTGADASLTLISPAGNGAEIYIAGNGNNGATSLLLQQDGTSTGYICNLAGTLYVGAGSQNAIGIGTAGNVTINAPTSGTALTVDGTPGTYGIILNSGSAATTGSGDLYITRNGSTANSIGTGPSIQLQDLSASPQSATMLQQSGGQTELWQYNGTWQQVAYFDTSHQFHTQSHIIGGGNIQIGDGQLFSNNGSQKIIITDANDGYLRLNNNSNFSNGVYTPGDTRADGATFIGPSYNLQQNTVATYGSISLNGAKGGYTGLLLNDGGYLPTFMSNGTSFGVYSQGTSSYWSWVDNGATFTIDKPIVGNGSITANAESHFAGGGTFTDPQPNVVRDIKCGQDGIAYTGGMHGDNADLTGSITFDSLYEGLSFSFTSATPTYKTSGTWITGGDDNAGLGAINDLALQTWWGVSISPTISGQTIPQGTACWSVDARAGDMYLTNNSYIGGTMYDNSNTGYYVKASSTSVLNNLNLGGRVSFANNVWNISADGTNRMYFATNADSYWEAHGGYHHFRNGSDTDVVTIDMSGNIVANGNVTAGSDIALKTEIETIKNGLDKVKELTGITFRYKDQETRSTGLIAQDVEKVLPEAVGESSTGFKTLAYGNLVGLLVEAIKDMDKKLEDLAAKVEKLSK